MSRVAIIAIVVIVAVLALMVLGTRRSGPRVTTIETRRNPGDEEPRA